MFFKACDILKTMSAISQNFYWMKKRVALRIGIPENYMQPWRIHFKANNTISKRVKLWKLLWECEVKFLRGKIINKQLRDYPRRFSPLQLRLDDAELTRKMFQNFLITSKVDATQSQSIPHQALKQKRWMHKKFNRMVFLGENISAPAVTKTNKITPARDKQKVKSHDMTWKCHMRGFLWVFMSLFE